jgi:chloride channel 3/4/5
VKEKAQNYINTLYMSSSQLNEYPTDEELYIRHSSSLPIVSYKEKLDSRSFRNEGIETEINNKLEIPTLSSVEIYENDQIIPWRKLYTEKRREDILLQSSIDSPILKFILRYNQWPVVIVSTIIIAAFTIVLDWTFTWLDNVKYGYCASSILTVRESCKPEDWRPFGQILPSILAKGIQLLVLLLFATSFAVIGLKISNSDFWIAKSGIGELKLIISGHVNNQFLNPSVVIKKFIALVFVCASGGLLLGYEGPLIHISCGVINFVIDEFASHFKVFQNLKNEATRREIISIGFVIGISLAFGAPIGGLLFSVENLKLGTKFNSLMWNGFVCSSLATFIFFKFHPFKKISINEAFAVDLNNGWILFETIPYIFLGFVCGFLSLIFNKLHLKILNWKTKVRSSELGLSPLFKILQNPFLEISLLVIVTHLLLYPLNFGHLTLDNMLKTLFYDCNDTNELDYEQAICKSSHEWFELVYYFIIIFFQSNYSYSLDIPGGILLPSLTIGALIGRIVGELVEIVQKYSGSNVFLQCYEEKKNCVSPGSYAIVGAAAFFAGVTNTSVAAVVIVFELTGAVTYLIPLMLGVVISKSIIDVFDSKGFDELWLMKSNKNYLSSDLSESYRLAQFSEIKLSDVIGDYSPNIIYSDDPLLTVEQITKEIDQIYEEKNNFTDDIGNDGFVILKNKLEPKLLSWIGLNDLYKILQFSDHKMLVSFATSDDKSTDFHTLKLDTYMTPHYELFKVSSQYSLLSAYQLMDRLLLTNIFICDDGKYGSEFKGILRITELSKLINS